MSEVKVLSEMTGSVWKVMVRPGDRVTVDEPLVILESMKMEIPVLAPVAGVVSQIAVSEGSVISEGALVAVLED